MTLADRIEFIRSGQMYNDLTPGLIKAREEAVLLTNRYNASSLRKLEGAMDRLETAAASPPRLVVADQGGTPSSEGLAPPI